LPQTPQRTLEPFFHERACFGYEAAACCASERRGAGAARIDSPLVFPAVKGGHIRLDNWRHREWYPALEAAGLQRRGPYALRHSFATEALHAGVSVFELARVMGTSVEMIDRTYGHLARDSFDSIRGRLDAHNAVEAAEGGSR